MSRSRRFNIPHKIHVNDYERFSKSEKNIGPPNVDEKCDYYHSELTKDYIDVYSIDKKRSSVLSVRYNFGSKMYSLAIKKEETLIFKKSIDDFFGIAQVGFQERKEIEAIKKIIEPLIEKL